jgi:non-heme chloroperoxidase
MNDAGSRHLTTDRRGMLRSAVLTAVGGGLLAAGPSAQAGSRHDSRRTADFIQTEDGTRLAYKDWGDGRPVVFVHAWALPSQMWDYQLAPLCEHGLRCVAYDRRGHGRSSLAGSGYDADTLADDLATVLEELDLNDVSLVGHSFAAGDIVRYMTRHGPARIAKIVLVAPAATPFVLKTADNPSGIPAEQLEYFRSKVLQRDFPGWLEENKSQFFVADTSPAMQNWVLQMMHSTPLRVAIEYNRAMTTTDFRPDLRKISVPTLVIHGDKDVSAPLDLTGRPTAAQIPGAELKIYEGAPHGLFLTHKDRLNADLLAFITA